MGWGLEWRSASSSQRECVLTVANKVQLSTRRGKAETKELFFVSTFLFFLGGGRGFYLRSVAFLCVVLCTRNCQRQTRPRLLAAASAATQKPPPTPLHVRGCCAMRRFIWRYRVARFKFTAELNLVPSSGRSRRLKFERKMIRRSVAR